MQNGSSSISVGGECVCVCVWGGGGGVHDVMNPTADMLVLSP